MRVGWRNVISITSPPVWSLAGINQGVLGGWYSVACILDIRHE
jgi:hypothetical protein